MCIYVNIGTLVLLQVFLELSVGLSEPEAPLVLITYFFVSLLEAEFGVLECFGGGKGGAGVGLWVARRII